MRMLVCTSVLSYSLVLCFSHFSHVRWQNQEDLDFHWFLQEDNSPTGLHQHRAEILFFSLKSAYSLLNLSPFYFSPCETVMVKACLLLPSHHSDVILKMNRSSGSFSGSIRGQPGNQIVRGCMIDIWRTAKLLALDHKRFQTTGKSLGLLEASKHTARAIAVYCGLTCRGQKCK